MMDLIPLGKECISQALQALQGSSAEIIQFKGPTKNIQITADIRAQKAILTILKKSNESFIVIVEEKENLIRIGANPKIEVYIDPLDGSSFFLTGNKRFCCTALMFVYEGKVLAAFVGDLMTGNIYHCDEKVAYFNNKKIIFSPERKGERYFVAAYATKGQRIKNELPRLADLAQGKILLFNNSGPLEQAMVTTGEFDAAVDLLPLSLWDYCGTAIAQKAGAVVTTREGTAFQYKNIKQTCVTARNKEIQEMLLKALNN